MTSLPPGEATFRDSFRGDPDHLVPWFLMASYLYYHEDESLLTDQTYDTICRALLASWDLITHRHKHLIDHADLLAGTAFRLPRDAYPAIAVSAAQRFFL